MKILNKKEFKELIDKNPGARFAFFEYVEHVFINDLHVLDADVLSNPYFGATTISTDPDSEFIFDYDWNLNEYSDDDIFAVLEKSEIIQLQELLDKVTGL